MCGIAYADLHSVHARPKSSLLSRRGPDGRRELIKDRHYFYFSRLAIINQGEDGMQPFEYDDGGVLVCNGELYNFRTFATDVRSDVDVIPLTSPDKLDGIFAYVYVKDGKVTAARDPVGVCPLFYSTIGNDVVAFASEAKALVHCGDDVHVFPPGHIYENGSFRRYTDIYDAPVHDCDTSVIRTLFDEAVRKRIAHSDRPLAFLCSGGLDSAAVVCSAAVQFPDRPFFAFSAEFLGAHSQDAYFAEQLLRQLPTVTHIRVVMTPDQVDAAMEEIIRTCETDDPITIRAAVPMWFLAKYISEKYDCKVVLSGEGSDELFCGYTYFRNAPSEEDTMQESIRLIQNLHQYDLLRAERTFAAHGLELRPPFLDKALVRYCASMRGKAPVQGGLEKNTLRQAVRHLRELERTNILNRSKMCLTDGVGYGMVAHIVRKWVDAEISTPEAKIEAEKNGVETVYKKYFGSLKLVKSRAMPEWANAKPLAFLS